MAKTVSDFRLRCISQQLHHGEVIAYPTEAVYGLGCDPLNETAVHYLLELKSRSVEKGLILIAANFEQISPFIEPLSAVVLERLMKSWPGPVTWLLPALSWVPYWLRGNHQCIAVRVTAHPAVCDICSAFGGPIVSTSANLAKKRPAMNRLSIKRYFGPELLIAPGQLGGLKGATRIIDALTNKVIRN